jgi:hypothetical protein
MGLCVLSFVVWARYRPSVSCSECAGGWLFFVAFFVARFQGERWYLIFYFLEGLLQIIF